MRTKLKKLSAISLRCGFLTTKTLLLSFLLVVCFGGFTFAQNVNHIIESLQVGEILVLSHTVPKVDENGKEVKVVNYQATTIAEVGLKACLQVMKETIHHNKFINHASRSEKIALSSANEWINYYSFKGSCSIPTYDCVLKMTCIENYDENSFAFMGIASPNDIDNRGVVRLENYNMICVVRELEENKVEISLFTEFVPIGLEPDWKIKMHYPNPANLIEGIVCLAHNRQN